MSSPQGVSRGLLRRFAGAIGAALLLGLVAIIAPHRAGEAVSTIGLSLKEMLLVIPPIFVLLGLMDVWVPREQLMRHMGEKSRVRGAALAFVIGSVAAGPLYAAFPVATVLMQKGASTFNVMVFVGAWSTTKMPMFLFEFAALGGTFAVTRLLANIPAIFLIALVLTRITPYPVIDQPAAPPASSR
ncbi:MAG: permease [Alkalispirochaeta sp.]